MVVDERSRHNLHVKLEQVLGEAEAETFMEMMPPVGWADVATKRDLDTHAAAMKTDLDNLATLTKRDLDTHAAAMKTDLDNLAVTTKQDLNNLALVTQSLASAVDLKLDSLENKLLAAFRAETRTWIFSMMAFYSALLGVFFAVFKLT